METKQDIGFFDGSADPNPGGRLGAGWRIQWADGRPETTGSAEWPAAPENTNNVGEYSALIGLLSDYCSLSGKGPLVVYGDSQLIIRQMTGEYSVRSPQLANLNEEASTLARGIPGGVSFRWIPREANAIADSLAGGHSIGEQEPAVYALTSPQEVVPALAAQIARLNRQGKMGFKEAMNLRVGGKDTSSGKYLQELAGLVGETGVQMVATAFPSDPKAQETALRWACRGLAVHLAIRKVQVDAEVHANAEKGRRSGQW